LFFLLSHRGALFFFFRARVHYLFLQKKDCMGLLGPLMQALLFVVKKASHPHFSLTNVLSLAGMAVRTRPLFRSPQAPLFSGHEFQFFLFQRSKNEIVSSASSLPLVFPFFGLVKCLALNLDVASFFLDPFSFFAGARFVSLLFPP